MVEIYERESRETGDVPLCLPALEGGGDGEHRALLFGLFTSVLTIQGGDFSEVLVGAYALNDSLQGGTLGYLAHEVPEAGNLHYFIIFIMLCQTRYCAVHSTKLLKINGLSKY